MDAFVEFLTEVNRETDTIKYINLFIKMWNEDQNLALRLIMKFRDINGKGEKKIPQVLLFIIKITNFHIYKEIVKHICINYGCWKDLLVIAEFTVRWNELGAHELLNNDIEFKIFSDQLLDDIKNNNVSLAAKWAPSEKTHYNNNSLLFANKLANLMNLTPRGYRKMLSNLRSHIIIKKHKFSKEDPLQYPIANSINNLNIERLLETI
jgi:hypothetical protein